MIDCSIDYRTVVRLHTCAGRSFVQGLGSLEEFLQQHADHRDQVHDRVRFHVPGLAFKRVPLQRELLRALPRREARRSGGGDQLL